jgi:hypothetical protein
MHFNIIRSLYTMISVRAHFWLFLLFCNAFENKDWKKKFSFLITATYCGNILIPSTGYRNVDVLNTYFAITTPDTLLTLNSVSSL